MSVAALYVETNGVYYGLPDVEFRDVLLDMARSASPALHRLDGCT